MKVRVRFFAAYREWVGTREELLFVLARAEDAAGGSEDWTRTNAEERRKD